MSLPPKHISIRPLTVYDLDQVMELEAKCFSPEEMATREKFEYRLRVCPELCSGLFVRTYLPKYQKLIDKEEEEYQFNGVNEYEFQLAAPHQSSSPYSKAQYNRGYGQGSSSSSSNDSNELPPSKSTIVEEKLIGHLISTKIYDDKITDRSMQIPRMSLDLIPLKEDDKIGHVEKSRTIGIHSLAIDDKYRGRKLGSLLLKDFLQKLDQQDFSDLIVLICHDYLIKFYESFGFQNNGKSACKFGGDEVEWYDLSCHLIHEDDMDEEGY